MKSKYKNIVFIVCMLLCSTLCLSLSSTAIKVIADRSDSQINANQSNTSVSKYEGKTISFLGDSITTFNGWSNNATMNTTIADNGYYYTGAKLPVNDTYWKRVLNALDMTLCVNNSWNGGRVTATNPNIPSGVTRASQLHKDRKNIKPDVIIVYMGTNDLANNISLDTFKESYSEMLDVLKTNYPRAEVYCCTILPESRTESKGAERNAYNEAIRYMTKSAGYEVVDFAEDIPTWDYSKLTIDDGDMRVHPNVEGMKLLADCIIKILTKKA